MKKKLLIGTILLLGLGIIVYSIFPRVAYSSSSRMPTASWTLIFYLDGDNAGEWFQLQKFVNIAWPGSFIDFNIVAQLDRIPGYDDSYDNWTGTRRFYLTPGMTPTDAHTAVFLGEQNMGDPATLAGFISWAKTNYPARNYALILCGPTTDWGPFQAESLSCTSFCRDDSSAGDSLSLTELKNVLRQTGGVQFIYFENQDMDIVEAAYQVKDYCQVMLGVSHPFESYWPSGYSHSDWTPAELGIDFAFSNYPCSDDICPPRPTQTLLDLTCMDSLARAVDDLAKVMMSGWDSDKVGIRAAARRVMNELDNSAIPILLYGNYCQKMPRIYFPMQESDFDPAYNDANLDFAADTQWDEFLQEFYHSMTGSWFWQVRKRSGDTQYIDLYTFCDLLTKRMREYYTEDQIPHTFHGGGTIQDSYSEYGYFTYPLPFDFPYFGEIIPAGTPIDISSQGLVDLPFPHFLGGYGLIGDKRIAPYMVQLTVDGSAQANEGVYITENTDNLVIRWAAETSYYAMPVNFETVLFKDGRIQFNYGRGNDYSGYSHYGPPTIGFSKGDRVNYYFSLYDGQTKLKNVDSVLFSPIIEPAIAVTAPTAGTFFTGQSLTAAWTTTGIDSGTVRLVLKKSDNSAVYELDPAAPYNGSPRTYIIPCAVATGDYYVRVVQGAISGKSANIRVNKISPCFSVIRPRGGETFVTGEQMTIKWVSTGITGDLRINLRKTDGSVVYLVAGSVPSTGTPYTYTMPATVSPGTYHIRIKQGTTTLGDSQPFTITH